MTTPQYLMAPKAEPQQIRGPILNAPTPELEWNGTGIVEQENRNREEEAANVTTFSQRAGTIAGWLGILAILSAGILATVGSPNPANDETVHANWRHVADATEHNRVTSGQQLKFINWGGQESWTTSIAVSPDDEDVALTDRILGHLEGGDFEQANAALQSTLDDLPAVAIEGSQASLPRPSITKGMAEDLQSGDCRFYRISLYDSCDQDGDVVYIRMNGEIFAVVPITHRGATLAVPVGSGTTIALEGVRDGGGGITVACRTSQGDYFASAMYVGEVQTISIVK